MLEHHAVGGHDCARGRIAHIDLALRVKAVRRIAEVLAFVAVPGPGCDYETSQRYSSRLESRFFLSSHQLRPEAALYQRFDLDSRHENQYAAMTEDFDSARQLSLSRLAARYENPQGGFTGIDDD
jgi:hypothetical protein